MALSGPAYLSGKQGIAGMYNRRVFNNHTGTITLPVVFRYRFRVRRSLKARPHDPDAVAHICALTGVGQTNGEGHHPGVILPWQ